MSMKKILMAAAAVTALTAGSANALTLNADNSYVASTALTGGVAGVSFEPYTLANEYNVSTATVVPAKLTLTTSSALAASTSYIVTYTISGGTFDNSTAIAATEVKVADTAAAAAGTGASGTGANITGLGTTILGTLNNSTAPTQVSFVISTGTATTVQAITWKLAGGIKPATPKTPVTITASIALSNSPTVYVDGGATSSVTLLDYRDGLTFAATAASSKLSLASGFKKFQVSGAADAVSANIASAVGFAIPTVLTTAPNDKVYKDLAGTLLATTDIASVIVTVGGDLSVFNARLGSAQLADSTTAPSVITADSGNLSSLRGQTATVALVQKATANVGTESTYTVTPAITLGSSLVPLTYTAKTIGAVSFEGSSLFVPWVSDGANGTNNVIRIGNKSATTAVTSVKASLLNPTTAGTSGTVASTATCELGTIAAPGEMVINSATLTACFGAFKRSDVRLTVQGAADNLTLKMRSSTAGITTENIVGSGVTASYGSN
jgi:hypothetical protein